MRISDQIDPRRWDDVHPDTVRQAAPQVTGSGSDLKRSPRLTGLPNSIMVSRVNLSQYRFVLPR